MNLIRKTLCIAMVLLTPCAVAAQELNLDDYTKRPLPGAQPSVSATLPPEGLGQPDNGPPKPDYTFPSSYKAVGDQARQALALSRGRDATFDTSVCAMIKRLATQSGATIPANVCKED